MMEHHKKNLEGLEGQEKAKAESKVFREAADKIGLSEATKLTHKSAIRNYLGFCIEKGYSPFVTTACGSQINLETYDSWVLWLVEPKENGKTFKYNTVKRYVSACRAWCCRHFIKYAREKKSYEAIQQMKTASKLVDVEEVQAAILPPIDIFRMLHGCDWSSEKGLRLASRMLVSFVSGARPLSLAKIQLKHLQLQPKFMNGKLQSMDVRVKIVHDKVESVANRHQTWFSGNRVGLCNIILLMQYLSKRQVFTHGTFENALKHEFIQFKKECLDEYLFSDIGKGLEPQPLENFRYELKCIAKNVGIQEEKVCPYSFRRSGATWSVGNSIIEKGSITQNDLEVIIRYYGWKFAASNEIARKYMDKRLLEFFDGAIQFMGLQSNRKWTEEDLERKFRKTPSDEPGYNYHSIRLAMPDYFKEEIAKFHQIQYNELMGENIAKAIDRWTFAKLQQLQVATSIDVKVNLVTLYRLFLHFNRIKILDQLKSLTCFHGDVSHAEMAMEVTGDDSTKMKPPQLTSEVVKGTPQLTSEVAVVTPPQLTSEVTNDTAPPSACEENRTPKDMTSLLELLQSIAQESSSNTTRVSDAPKESNINTPSGLSFNLLNHKKEERLLNSELPLPKNKHGQHVSAQLFWTSLKPGPKMKKPVRKENKRRMNEKNWEKIIPRIAMDAATLLNKYPQLVDQIKATKEYGLALDWLSEFESYGTCQRLESRLSTFPNCGYIEQFIVSVIELTNASFKIITEIWIREEIISPSTDNPRMYEINSGQLLEAQNVYSLRDVKGDEIDESFIPVSARTVVHLDASQVTLENYEHASKDILRQFMRKKLGSISNKIINYLTTGNLVQASKTILESERDKLEIDGDALKKELEEIALKNKEASPLSDTANKTAHELTLADYKQATSNGLRSFIRSRLGSISNDVINHLVKKEMQQIVEQLLKEKSTHEEIKSQMIDWSNANKERKKKQSSKKRTKGGKKKKDDIEDCNENEEHKKLKRKQNKDSNTKQTKKSKK
ncbi:hypothetical protein C9374_012485 [Naegleria lovaniensis]|uniref:Tyr recombinase domain-containing protein n=1 Tax=Naegleria lovaniensis TaxID=51637 RepID=A0AA88GZV5_NAELO|nr:uncharacterized protein C9374_012485 [Naegleria lovaniensis]KAG2392233.1 hypothetical protein C9374_012485 [Naegleria lovaniensis]